MEPRAPYATDLTDAQWQTIQALMPTAKNGRTGRPRKWSTREMWNAIFYQARTGCAWRHLPHDLPPWNAVWVQFVRWRDKGVIQQVHDALREQVRRKEGREPTPSAAIIDRQSVRTTQKGGTGVTTRARTSRGANAILR